MLLYAWHGTSTNFGDELNRLLWPRLLPRFFDDDPATLFLGIGSVLDARHDGATRKLVAGSGYGGYAAPPALDASWIIHWVRGPRTARLLGLPAARGIGDPAMLITAPRGNGREIGFMPHFESLARGAWTDVAGLAGITLIDPRDDPAAIVASISNCRILLSEAMHGVIVADALRVPWIALQPLVTVHRAKWLDWAESLSLRIRFHPLAASSALERLSAAPIACTRPGRHLLGLAESGLRHVARRRFIEQAVQRLSAAAAAPPQLSSAAALDRCRSRMREQLDALRRNPFRLVACAGHH